MLLFSDGLSYQHVEFLESNMVGNCSSLIVEPKFMEAIVCRIFQSR